MPEAQPNVAERHHNRPHAPLRFLGVCCGVGVSTIYLCQPLLPEMGATFHVGAAGAGMVGVATQVGYAAGLLSFVPLGDIVERRSLMTRLYAAVAVALLLVALSPTLGILLFTSVVCGALACVTHVALPIAPDLAEPQERGKAIGIVMTGLLLGVLLARTFSGWINDLSAHITSRIAGWRVVFLVAAVVSAAFVPAIRRTMPVLPPKQQIRYKEAMRSLWTLFRAEPLLRESCLMGALVFAAFSVFWNTLAFALAAHKFGAGVAGTFGLVGAAGAIIASQMGRLSDRKGPRYVMVIGLVLSCLAYAGIYGSERFARHAEAHGPLPTVAYLAALAVAVVVLDMGMQTVQLANQTRIFALQPQARSRINTLYMFSYFVGGAAGSALSTVAWQHFGATGVAVLEAVLLLLAVLRHATGLRIPFVPHAPGEGEPVLIEM